MNERSAALQSGGRNLTVLGVLVMVLGILAMLTPGLAGASVILFVGILVAGAGLTRMIWALRAPSLGRSLLGFIIGGLTLLCGVALISNPLFGAKILTIVLTIYFVADGIAELAAGFAMVGPGKGWMLFGGILSIVLGIMIWRQYPLSGMWAIGVLLGIKLFFVGVIMITGGSVVRSLGKR